jgi:hypothetical protein
MEREIHRVWSDPDFYLDYEQYGPIKVFHSEVSRWTHNTARRYLRAVNQTFKALQEPVFVAFYTDGQHGPRFDRFLRWLGFKPFAEGEYDGAPCIFYAKVK